MQHIEHAYLYLAAHDIPKVARFTYNNNFVPIGRFDSCMLTDLQKPTLGFITEELEKKLNIELLGADNMHFNPLVHEVFAEEYVSEITNLL